MEIIAPLTYTITNGQAVDAPPLMANLNQIVNNVNANAAAINGSSTQVFNVANATTSTQATTLSQVQSLIAQATPTSGVRSFNTRTGSVTLTSSDVAGALGYTPASASAQVSSFNTRTGAVTLTSADVTTALGYTPTSGTTSGTTSGMLNVTDYGVNGSSTDAANMATAIAAAISQNKKLYAPAITINMGATTLTFPATMPRGFTFECDPGCVINYTGTGDIVNINSCYHASFTFGILQGQGGNAGIHFQPTSTGPNGQIASVVSTFNFGGIFGCRNSIYIDVAAGDFAQNQVNGMEMTNGQSYGGTFSGQVCGILVEGSSARIYQGNQFNINYIQPAPASLATGTTWIGINDGSSSLGIVANNVNTYQFGAIDGNGWTNSYGLNIWSQKNMFIGPVVDTQTCVQLGSVALQALLVCQTLSSLSGGTQINNLSSNGSLAYEWVVQNNGTITSKLQDWINVLDFGADPTGAADSAPAFQAAINALPSGGGRIIIGPGTWLLNTQPTWGGKTMYWDIDMSARFTGSGAAAGLFPYMVTNPGQLAVGPYIQCQATTVSQYPTAAAGIAAFQIEMLQPSDYVGQSVGMYIGSEGSNSNANADVWALNTLIRANAGAGGVYQCIEVDVDCYSSTALVKGISISGGGTQNPDVGLELVRLAGTLWTKGIHVLNSQDAIQIDMTSGGRGLVIGAPVVEANNAIAIQQPVNGQDTIFLERQTNSSPLGWFIRGVDAANSTNIFIVDVVGNLFAAGSINAPFYTLTGASIPQSGTTACIGNSISFTAIAGSAGAPPAQVAAYWVVYFGNQMYRIPAYL